MPLSHAITNPVLLQFELHAFVCVSFYPALHFHPSEWLLAFPEHLRAKAGWARVAAVADPVDPVQNPGFAPGFDLAPAPVLADPVAPGFDLVPAPGPVPGLVPDLALVLVPAVVPAVAPLKND